jgi:cytoskeletal protein CcmA (bactofilin family)
MERMMMRKRYPRGSSLVTILVLSALMFTMLVAMAGAGLHHLNLTTRSSNVAVAQNLADSAVSKVIARVLHHESETGAMDYGVDGLATVEVYPSDGVAGARGIASFDADFLSENANGLPPSVNNLNSDASLESANGMLIPGGTLYLTGYGTCGGVERRVEAIIHLPRFPFSLASEGPLQGADILVASLPEGSTLKLGQDPSPEDLRPGNLLSNSKLGDDAIQIMGESKVKGDVESASGVLLGNEASVEGKIQPHCDPFPLPTLDIGAYRPHPDDPTVNRGLASINGNLVLATAAHYQGGEPLRILNGLTLKGGVLFVDNDLEIHGGISGKGAIVATGDIRVTGSGSVQTDNLAALVSGGDITIDGGSDEPKSAIFEGLVYAKGKLSARNVSVVGVAISKGSGGVELESVRLFENPKHAQIVIGTQLQNMMGSPDEEDSELGPKPAFTLDVSAFMGSTDRMRVRLWRNI